MNRIILALSIFILSLFINSHVIAEEIYQSIEGIEAIVVAPEAYGSNLSNSLLAGQGLAMVAPEASNSRLGLTSGDTVLPGELDAVGSIPRCTATLISDDLVLTAAHCVCGKPPNQNNCDQTTTFTLHDVIPIDDPSTSVDESQNRQDIFIPGTVHKHPDYGVTSGYARDIAVIKLDRHVSEMAAVNPIRLERPGIIPQIGDILTLVGFGLTGSRCANPSRGKLTAQLPVKLSNEETIRFEDYNIQTCAGDSGGPILNAAGRVVGVASWKDNDGKNPPMLTSNYRPTWSSYDWIQSWVTDPLPDEISVAPGTVTIYKEKNPSDVRIITDPDLKPEPPESIIEEGLPEVIHIVGAIPSKLN